MVNLVTLVRSLLNALEMVFEFVLMIMGAIDEFGQSEEVMTSDQPQNTQSKITQKEGGLPPKEEYEKRCCDWIDWKVQIAGERLTWFNRRTKSITEGQVLKVEIGWVTLRVGIWLDTMDIRVKIEDLVVTHSYTPSGFWLYMDEKSTPTEGVVTEQGDHLQILGKAYSEENLCIYMGKEPPESSDPLITLDQIEEPQTTKISNGPVPPKGKQRTRAWDDFVGQILNTKQHFVKTGSSEPAVLDQIDLVTSHGNVRGTKIVPEQSPIGGCWGVLSKMIVDRSFKPLPGLPFEIPLNYQYTELGEGYTDESLTNWFQCSDPFKLEQQEEPFKPPTLFSIRRRLQDHPGVESVKMTDEGERHLIPSIVGVQLICVTPFHEHCCCLVRKKCIEETGYKSEFEDTD